MVGDKLRVAAWVGLVLAGCATPPPPAPTTEGPKQQLFDGVKEEHQAFDPKSYLEGLIKPADCERRARSLLAESPDHAWQVLRACLDNGYFNDLRGALTNGWAPVFGSRPDGQEVLTQLIAVRGGDVEADVAAARKAGLKVHTLGEVLDQATPPVGSLVVLRATIDAVTPQHGGHQLQLSETRRKVNSKDKAEVYDYNSYTGRYYYRQVSKYTPDAHHLEDTYAEDTGNDLVAQAPARVKHLKTKQERIFLVRFQGINKSDDGAVTSKVEVLQAFEVATMMIY